MTQRIEGQRIIIQADDANVRSMADRLLQVMPAGVPRALNRAAKAGQVFLASNNGIRKHLVLKSASIKRHLSVPRQASKTSLVATIRGVGRNPNLTSFGNAKDTRKKTFDPKGKGVKVTFYRGKREIFPKAFIARGQFGKRPLIAFERVGKTRLKVKAVRGPSIVDVYKDKAELRNDTFKRIHEVLIARLRSQLQLAKTKGLLSG